MGVRLLLVMSMAGCSGELDRQSLVDGTRLLAISAQPPEAMPGDQVVVSTLWFGGDDPGPASFQWSRCAAPADGSIDRCDGPETELARGEGLDAVTFTAAADDHGITTLVRLSVCAVPAPGGCTVDTVDAVKRVPIGLADRPNHNPGIESFEVDAGGDGTNVVLQASPDAVEVSPEGEEALFVSWFATEGKFEDDRSFGPGPLRFEIRWTPPADAGVVQLWAVLRDGRGGVCWAEQQVTIE